ncbi:MAG: nucleoside triphosphate pyrophosphohydrolase [Steroidobacteraceae bacterium]
MSAAAAQRLLELLEIMRRLRDPQGGCPWDVRQDFRSVAPFTLEEAFEVADAIERDDPQAIRDELGDLLFQVVFHARMGEERGWFDFADVAAGIGEKLVRRHPHVFAPADAPRPGWEELKARERGASGETGTLAGIARALPALARASKLGRRAARVHFDWQSAAQVRTKVVEELAELDAAIAAAHAADPAAAAAAADGARAAAGDGGPADPRIVEELGDLLFAIANWSRHLGADAEEALRGANVKFERRFARMEGLAVAQGLELPQLSAADWDALWNEAKRADR